MNKAKDIPLNEDFVKRFKEKLELIKKQDNQCWEWQWSKTSQGYGYASYKKVHYTAHRISYNIFNGPLNKDMVIDHTCSNRKCVNPAHLRETTMVDNLLTEKERRDKFFTRYTKNKTILPKALFDGICKNGHIIKDLNSFYCWKRSGQSEALCFNCKKCKDDYGQKLSLKVSE